MSPVKLGIATLMKHPPFVVALILGFVLGLSACSDADERRMAELQSKCSPKDENYSDANIKGCTEFLALPNLARPVRAMTLNIRGNTYDALGKHDLAIADYMEVIKLLPDFSAAYANIGLQYCRMGDFKMALNYYDQALNVNPKSSYAMYGRGVALSRLGETDAARKQLSAANAADPAMARVYEQIGMEPAR